MNENFKDIVKSAISGDESAFEALYTMTKDSAYFIALSMTHNEQDALDILQESYIKAFSNLNKVDPPELFDNWFNQIVANCSKDFLKQKKPILFSDISDNVVIEDLEEETSLELIPHEFVDKQEASRLIMQIINGLPENKRLVILMYYYQNMSTNEIADSLGVPVSTVKYYLSAGRKEIKTELEKLDKEGTRLYAVIPFALFPSLIGQAAENVNAPVFSSVSQKIMKNVNSGISNPHIASSESQSHTISSTKLNGGKNMFLKTTASKIAAAVAAVAVVGGGITAAVIAGRNNQPQPVETSQVSQEDNSVNNENSQPDNTTSRPEASEDTESSTEPEVSYSPVTDFKYEILDNGIRITQYIGSDTEVVIPKFIEEQPVVEIGITDPEVDPLDDYGNYAFSGCDNLTSITIPDSVSTIGKSAFVDCDSLTSITIPDSVSTIGESAFKSCDNLTSITIPDSVSTIGDQTFHYCRSLTSITIPDGVTAIGKGAFDYCTSLTSITIPDSVTSIGFGAFSDCDSLTSITIPDSVSTIGSVAFLNCTGLISIDVDRNNKNYTSENGVLFNKNKSCLINYPGGRKDAYIIPDSVSTIGDHAFFDCKNLTSITIPDSVTTIGESAFMGCFGLTSINIPDSVTTIGEYAFSDCDSLTSITIPNSVSTIGGRAFRYCTSLTSITIPNSVTTIGEYAFSGCDSLTSITIPDSVSTIGDSAFDGCDSLTSITIPPSVTDFGPCVFNQCPLLTIKCKSGSAAESYAKENNIPYVAE